LFLLLVVVVAWRRGRVGLKRVININGTAFSLWFPLGGEWRRKLFSFHPFLLPIRGIASQPAVFIFIFIYLFIITKAMMVMVGTYFYIYK